MIGKTNSRVIAFTPRQKREIARHVKELEASLAEGRRGIARRVVLSTFLKEARGRFPRLAR